MKSGLHSRPLWRDGGLRILIQEKDGRKATSLHKSVSSLSIVEEMEPLLTARAGSWVITDRSMRAILGNIGIIPQVPWSYCYSKSHKPVEKHPREAYTPSELRNNDAIVAQQAGCQSRAWGTISQPIRQNWLHCNLANVVWTEVAVNFI